MISTGTRLVLGLAAAGVVAAGGAASTAAGTGVEDHYAGIDGATATGVRVTKIEYRQTPNESSTVDAIVFDVLEEVDDTRYHKVLTITGQDDVQHQQAGTGCVFDGSGTPRTITCDAAGFSLADVKSIDLAVMPKAVPSATPTA